LFNEVTVREREMKPTENCSICCRIADLHLSKHKNCCRDEIKVLLVNK